MRAVSSVLFVRTAVNLVSSNGFRVCDEFLVFLDAECLSVSGCVTLSSPALLALSAPASCERSAESFA
nr:MAG TPA: hypothetical protein [Caudoviricetes sp.]